MIPLHTHQNGSNEERHVPTVGEDVDQLKLPDASGGSLNRYSYFGKSFTVSVEPAHKQTPGCNVPLVDMHPLEMHTNVHRGTRSRIFIAILFCYPKAKKQPHQCRQIVAQHRLESYLAVRGNKPPLHVTISMSLRNNAGQEKPDPSVCRIPYT